VVRTNRAHRCRRRSRLRPVLPCETRWCDSPEEWLSTRNFAGCRSDNSPIPETQTSRIREITARASLGGEPPPTSIDAKSKCHLRESWFRPAITDRPRKTVSSAAVCQRKARRFRSPPALFVAPDPYSSSTRNSFEMPPETMVPLPDSRFSFSKAEYCSQ
jgi:hypothetical protein